MARKIAARIGLPKKTRNSCSNASPAMPTGIVAKMIIQASFSFTDRNCHRLVPGSGRAMWPSELKNPPMIRTQSRQK